MIAPALLADGPGGALVGPSGEAPSWRLAAGEAIFHGGDESLDVLAAGLWAGPSR